MLIPDSVQISPIYDLHLEQEASLYDPNTKIKSRSMHGEKSIISFKVIVA